MKYISNKTIKNYHGLCLKCDLLLLADVYEKFRNSSLKDYGLNLSHYFSARDATLNMTKIEVASDDDMYLLFEKSTTGGVSHIANRYSKASNNYLK